MTTCTIQLDDALFGRMASAAAAKGVPLDTLVGDILRQHVEDPAAGLVALIERAKREGWKSDGPFMTDDEMYTR